MRVIKGVYFSFLLLSLSEANVKATEVVSSPSNKQYQPNKEVTFDSIVTQYENYQVTKDPEVRTHIINMLNRMIIRDKLSPKEKQQALIIAQQLKTRNLAIRLKDSMSNTITLPVEAMRVLMAMISETGDLRALKNLLITSKTFNKALLTAPITINLSPYKDRLDDNTLAKIIQLFPNIRSLSLRNCYKITDRGLIDLQYLTDLESLDLSLTEISAAGFMHIKDLVSLTKLNLNYTKISDRYLLFLENLINLSSLDLSDTQISDSGLIHIKNLRNLTSLNLFNTDITDRALKNFENLTHITSLNLRASQITDDGLEILRKIPTLESLNIADTTITDEGLFYLHSLNKLNSLNARKTLITNHGVEQLKAKIPGIRILF